MLRPAHAMLSLLWVPLVVVALPVLSLPEPAPHPVPSQVSEVDLGPVASSPPALLRQAAQDPAVPAPRTLLDSGERPTVSFTVAGLTWTADPAVGELDVELRTRTNGQWTTWRRLGEEQRGSSDPGSPPLRAGTAPTWVGPSDGAQVRVTLLTGAVPRDLRLVLVQPGTSAADASRPTAPGRGLDTARAATSQPAVLGRADWGADESIRRGSPSYASTISAVAVHHTASSNDYTQAQVPSIIRGFYAYHVTSLGWEDIGYNFLVDKFGTIWEGRAGGIDRPVIGAHAGGFNTNTAGVAMIGNFTSQPLPSSLLTSVARVAAWKLSLYGRDPNASVVLTSGGNERFAPGTQVSLRRVFGHRDVSSTGCPGDLGYQQMQAIRDKAAEFVAGSGAGSPRGALDAISGGVGQAVMQGWAADIDAVSRTSVRVTVDGLPAARIPADSYRPDVSLALPGFDVYHGFFTAVPAEPGQRRICITAVNEGMGDDLLLGCASVTVTGRPTPTSASPTGQLDEVAGGPLGIRVRGWAADTDASTFTDVTVSVDGRAAATVTANSSRPDVSVVYPQFSSRHGFEAQVRAAVGTRQVCVTAVNQGSGTDRWLGCRTLYVRPATVPSVVRGTMLMSRDGLDSGPADQVAELPAQGVAVTGDWGGTGRTSVGVFVDGRWYLTDPASPSSPPRTVVFGQPGDLPVVGDWNGDGVDTFGVVRNGRWYVTDAPAGGIGQRSWLFGNPGDIPVTGDWNGDGVSTAGVVRNGTWLLTDTPGREFADRGFPFGDPSDLPVVGDWNGDGRDSPGVLRDGTWYLTDQTGRSTAEMRFAFGQAGDRPLTRR